LYEPDTLTPPNLVSIALTPSNPTYASLLTVPFIATGTFSNNTTQRLAPVIWSSSNPAGVSITNDATNEGTAYIVEKASDTPTVTACAGAICGSTLLNVVPLKSISISPADSTTGGIGFVQFTATATFWDNSTQDVTGSVSWGSSNSAVVGFVGPPNFPAGDAVISNGGTSTVTVTIYASMDGITGSTLIYVNPFSI